MSSASAAANASIRQPAAWAWPMNSVAYAQAGEASPYAVAAKSAASSVAPQRSDRPNTHSAAIIVNRPEVTTAATYDVHAIPGKDPGSTPAHRDTTRAACTGPSASSAVPGALSE